MKACVEPESNQTSSMSCTCSHFGSRLRDEAFEEALLGASLEPDVGALLGERLVDARDQLLRLGEVADPG